MLLSQSIFHRGEVPIEEIEVFVRASGDLQIYG